MKDAYRYVFLTDSEGAFAQVGTQYDAQTDLVLTFDFALHHALRGQGADCEFADRLVDRDTMQRNNWAIYRYFQVWNLRDGHDAFVHKGIPFGFAFRQEIWNDFTFYLRLRICLAELKKIRIGRLVVVSSQPFVSQILGELGLAFESQPLETPSTGFFFPVFRWMHEQVNPNTVKGRLRRLANRAIFTAQSFLALVGFYPANRKSVFVQAYHPTRPIIAALRDSGEVNVTLIGSTDVTKLGQTLRERLVPLRSSTAPFAAEAAELLGKLRSPGEHRLVLANGDDATDGVTQVVVDRIAPRVADYLRILDGIIRHFDRVGLDLVILIGNLGIFATLVESYARAREVPRYMVVNGLLAKEYMDDAKYADIINSYSESVRDHYFREMTNVFALGDPRMDNYKQHKPKEFSGGTLRILIGASGYSPVDLNSGLANEFEFLFSALEAMRLLRSDAVALQVTVKVRPNGYTAQYQDFCQRYFPDLEIRLEDKTPMMQVLEQADFYISIYSQTLFEASILGLPVVYLKTDTEYLDPPFDGNSDLVTVYTPEELAQSIRDFLQGTSRFGAFLRPEVMERYVGPLDGKNLERNLVMVRQMMGGTL